MRKEHVEAYKKKYGDDVFAKIGGKGGKKTGVLKGFAANPQKASEASKKSWEARKIREETISA